MNWSGPVAGALLSLTPRELEIVKLIALNQPNKAIADQLGIASKTVEHYRANIYLKLQVNSGISLTHLALAYGLVPNRFL